MSNTETAPGRDTPDTPARGQGVVGDDAPAIIGPGDTVGRYQVQRLIGAGGMGRVYTALDPDLGRTVALKVIRPDVRAPSSRDRARFLREAQALAKLQHPNVVAIHDVGTHDGQIFIAMEHIAGQTLAEWLAATPRPWRAVRDVFLAAGRGLAAAHAVGIVHRDFKPSNVMVGGDRVVVVDFGLARGHSDESAPDGVPTGGDSVLDTSLTLSGERVGTPLHMAPEQLSGDPVSYLADQFAFALALWAAAYGVPAFNGFTSNELLGAMVRGPAPPPPGRKVPDRIRTALARALAFRPDRRWPALSDLLVELARDPARTRRRVLAVAALAAAAIAAPLAFAAGRQAVVPSCGPLATGIWDDAARDEARAAFLATGKPYAGESFAIVDTALRERLAALDRAHEETCTGQPSPAAIACLDRAREQIAAFAGVLRSVDARGVERATGAAATVGELDSCSMTAPPRDPVAAAVVERELAHVQALLLVGRMSEAQTAAAPLVEKATALDHPPLLARALFAAATPGCEAGDPRDGVDALYRAARAASAGHDDVLAVKIYIKLVYCAGAKDANLAAAQALIETAEAALERIGSPLDLRARLYREESRIRRHAGDPVGAFGLAELSLMTYQRAHGEAAAETGPSFGDLGDILTALGAYRPALAMYARALPILERTRGPSHPMTATYLGNMGMAAAEAGDLEAAADEFTRALAIEEQDSLDQAGLPSMLRNLADLRGRQGRRDDMRELAVRARAIDEKTRRPGHPAFGRDLLLFAELALDDGRPDEAQQLAAQARAVFEKAYGVDHPLLVEVDLMQAKIARRRHDLAGARRLVEKAVAAHRKQLGPRHPSVASDESALGAILLEAGAPRDAVPLLESAVTIQAGARGDGAPEVVVARTLLAEASLATGDRGRAVALAELAVAGAGSGRLRADVEDHARATLARTLRP